MVQEMKTADNDANGIGLGRAYLELAQRYIELENKYEHQLILLGNN